MTIVKNTNGTYTIDTTVLNKATYPLRAVLSIDGTTVLDGVTATVLPYTGALTIGVHSVILTLYNVGGSIVEQLCQFTDDTLYCGIIERLKGLSSADRAKDTTPYLHYMLTKGEDNAACVCGCDGMKAIYDDLIELVNSKTCC
jgi:hypothetical protein